ncbi:hypothetical protein [Frankia sp. EI5c]|uniref:hypothetical protein n=1 Tax=Frankia sp. EI5c TaxID=683316 RepID=UPI000A47AE2C|nr:hypothetical protein [Frankia sp. EI5c]
MTGRIAQHSALASAWLRGPGAGVGWRGDGSPVIRAAGALPPPAGWTPSAGPLTGHPVAGEPASACGRPGPVLPGPVLPDPLVRRILDASLLTPAGRFFRPAWAETGPLPAAPPGLCALHLEASEVAIRLGEISVPAAFLARLIRCCPEWAGRPVLLVPRSLPRLGRLADLFAELAVTLAVGVYVADAGVWQCSGAVVTGGRFHRWPVEPPAAAVPAVAGRDDQLPVVFAAPPAVPAAGKLPAPVRVGLPAQTAWSPRTAPAADTGSPGPRPPEGRASEVSPLPADLPVPAPLPVPADLAPGPPRSWIEISPRATAADRERLRALLGWRYETHARAVLGALALNPGLRLGAGAADLLAGLVAVRAYLVMGDPLVAGAARGEGPTEPAPRGTDDVLRGLDDVLRGGDLPQPPEADAPALFAQCVQAGLERLPAVVGPVFRPATIGAVELGRHRPGDVLVEPAFVEVATTPWPLPTATAEYVIWASSARRLDCLAGGPGVAGAWPPGRALFPAGTRFVVLAVDAAGAGGVQPGGPARPGLARVLLREAVGGRAEAEKDRRALARLRAAVASPDASDTSDAWDASGVQGGGPAPRRPGLVVGFDGGRPFDQGAGRNRA